MSAAVLVTLGVGLALLGRWGRRNAARLVPPILPERERAHRAAVLRRGALGCHVIAAVFVLAGAVSLL